jgi:hypothetical protein
MTQRSHLAAAGLAAALAAAGLAAPAHATAYVMTATGTLTAFPGNPVSNNLDYEGVFGLGVGANLGGVAATETWVIDTTQPGAFTNEVFIPEAFIRTVQAISSITLTANGVTIGCATFDLCGAQNSNTITRDQDADFNWTDIYSRSDALFILSLDSANVPGLGLTPPDGLTSVSGLVAFGLSADTTTDMEFVANDITTTALGVPEPATWALMIAGFGLAGAGLRRRRMVVAAR